MTGVPGPKPETATTVPRGERHREPVALGRTGLTTTRFGFGSSVFGGMFRPIGDGEGRQRSSARFLAPASD